MFLMEVARDTPRTATEGSRTKDMGTARPIRSGRLWHAGCPTAGQHLAAIALSLDLSSALPNLGEQRLRSLNRPPGECIDQPLAGSR